MKKWNVEDSKVNSYLSVCKNAATSEDLFNTFKQNGQYKLILEHVQLRHSLLMLTEMKCNELDTNPLKEHILYNIEKIKENNKYGGPTLNVHPSLGTISPSTVRYLWYYWHIVSFFNKEKYSPYSGVQPLKQCSTVVEIGGGYGGLCTVIDSLIGFDDYYIFDLAEVNLLQTKYLDKSKLNGNTHALELDDCPSFNEGEIDLVISNYAISELPYNIQMEYIDKVVSKSKKFYFLWNFQSESQKSDTGISSEEFINKMSDKFVMSTSYEFNKVSSSGAPKIIYGELK